MSPHSAKDHLAELVQTCRAAEKGEQIVGMYDQTVQFTLLDGDTFYLNVENGQATLADGQMPEKSLDDGYEIKADTANLRAWFSGQERYSDLIEEGRMFPVASHTTKRHIDYWLAQIVRIGNGQRIIKEVY